MDGTVAVGVVLPERHADGRGPVRHLVDHHSEARDEGHRHEAPGEWRHVGRGPGGKIRRAGELSRVPSVVRRGIDRAVGDETFRDPLAGVVGHVDFGVDDLLAAAEDSRLRHDVLADGRRDVVDGEVQRAAAEPGPVLEASPRRQGPRDVDGRGRNPAVECPPGVRVLVLVRDADADAVCRSRLHAKAEPAVVRHVLEARRERADPFGHLTIRLDRHAAGGRDLYDARPGDAIEPAARDAASPLMR